jgi:hypothetical protein
MNSASFLDMMLTLGLPFLRGASLDSLRALFAIFSFFQKITAGAVTPAVLRYWVGAELLITGQVWARQAFFALGC